MRVPSPALICAVFLLVRGFLCQGQDTKSTNPCCHFPCQNWGVCVRFGMDRYECDCTRTGYYGENCTIPEFWSRVQQLLKPTPDVMHYILTHFKWLWDIINQTFLRNMLMRLVLQVRASLIPSPPTYNSKYGYLNWESYSNATYYTRILPPVPEDCPTPMGVKGKAVLPDPEVLVEKFLLRKKFRPDPQGSNLMFAFFAQHFTHQFFKTHNRVGLGFTKALGHGVDAGHIYGDNLARQLRLRLHKDGKLKYQVGDLLASKFEHICNILFPSCDYDLAKGKDKSRGTLSFAWNTCLDTQELATFLVSIYSASDNIGGGHNIHQVTAKVAVSTIKESRHLRFQSFNQYRKRFKLKPYTSFEEFTGEKIMARELEELYGDIDALEFYPALLLEKTRPGAIFGQSMVEMGSPFSLKGLLGNPVCSPEYWKPSTFGGQTGFDIVKSASLEKLVCLNTKKCPYVSFHVPAANDDQQQNEPKQQTEL
nr:prostaglandin G/H synthase 1-like [Paramormyrops kingsleyae]